jgi:ornithine cyclodeaminase
MSILYLSALEVARALEAVDVVEVVAAALAAHARGETVLPDEAHLAWACDDEPLRSLSMPALVGDCAGVKLINANPANPRRGLPRASGLIVLFGLETGRPFCILEAARISCLRTAGVTAVATDLLAPRPLERAALLGAGALARGHLELLASRLPALREIRVYDVDRALAAALAADCGGLATGRGGLATGRGGLATGRGGLATGRAVVCDSAEDAIRGAELVVTVTTTTTGYICHDWLAPGALLVNVSLDDPLPEVVLRADKVFVDDWARVAGDPRRLLGRMLRAGQITGPADPDGPGRTIDGELGEILIGAREGRAGPQEIILVNPFGLAVEDVAVARSVHRHAERRGLGTALAR